MRAEVMEVVLQYAGGREERAACIVGAVICGVCDSSMECVYDVCWRMEIVLYTLETLETRLGLLCMLRVYGG